jgi:7,8-dihydroneopterin aldolase/epimerase/oxygenase
MLGIIGFDHHKILCIVGTEPEERMLEQEIYVDLKVEADFSRCAASDLLQDTVNYVHLSEICTELACKGQYRLLESYAYAVLRKLLQDFTAINWAWIRVQKPQALATAKCTTVELKCFKMEKNHEMDFGDGRSQRIG